jgi:putative ABC transport system permease protein
VALEQAPKTFAALVMAPDDSAVATLQRDVVRRYPNVASLDLSLVRRTVAEISNRATTAIRFLAIFSLAMAVPVLFSAVSATTARPRARGRAAEDARGDAAPDHADHVQRVRAARRAGSLAGMILSFGGAWLLLKYVFERPFEPAFWKRHDRRVADVADGVDWLLAGRDVFKETPMAALRDT